MSTKISNDEVFVSVLRGCIFYMLLGCVALAPPSFAQTVPQSAHDASRELSSLGDVGDGIHVGGNFIFAVVELPWVGNIRRLEAAAELRLNRLLIDYLTIEQLENQGRKEISRLLLEHTEGIFAKPRRLRISVQVIESGPKDTDSDIYRRVVAIPLSAVSEAGYNRTAAENAYHELISDFLQRWQHYPDALEQLGFKSLSLLAERYVLGQQVNIVNVVAPDSTPIQTRSHYAKYLAAGDFQPKSLAEWPGEYEVTARQLDRYGERSRRGLAWASISCADPRSEFSEYIQGFISTNANLESSVSEDSVSIYKSVLRCHGFVTFDDDFSSESPTLFYELQRVFSGGADLSAALSLAHEVVEASPAFAQGWGYLSAAFRADGDLAAAKIASLVRLSLEPNTEPAVRQYLQLVESGADETMRQFVRDATSLLDRY